jgi:hypothetical protein
MARHRARATSAEPARLGRSQPMSKLPAARLMRVGQKPDICPVQAHARGDKMWTHVESKTRGASQRLAHLTNKAAELERQLSDTRVSLEYELAQCACGQADGTDRIQRAHRCTLGDAGLDHDGDSLSDLYAMPETTRRNGRTNSGGQMHSHAGRTETLVNHGRRSAYRPASARARKVAAAAVAAAVALVSILVIMRLGNGASWPASVATVQSEAAKACQNPDVKSEPGQVNFACAKGTRQILWVFAMLTSSDNPEFADAKTGRVGLEPITPAQGGEVAWSLNLHHPYAPTNPIDSLAVAARAINNIIGGATLTRANGKPVVQPGLESRSANCVRYTGSAAVTSRKDFPKLCARPVTSPAGRAALVSDVYQKWVVGAAPATAQNAAILFANADNPGDPRVQSILRNLQNSNPLA